MPEYLPHNLDAERAVIGVLLTEGAQFGRLTGLISADDFHLEAHRRIWTAIEEIYNVGGIIDAVTITDRLKDKGQLESVGGLSALLSIDNGMGSIFGAEQYCRLVKDDSVRRRAIVAADKLAKDLRLGGESSETLAQAERFLRDLAAENQPSRRLKSASEIVTERGGIDAFLERSKDPGIPTRWPDLNRIIGGWKAQQLVIIAARPSVGKTAAALDIAECAATQNQGVAVYSLEMSTDELLTRMACSRARIDQSRWQHGELGRDEQRRLRLAQFELTQLPIWYDDTAECTVPAIHASLRQLMAREQIGLVIVDYLQLLQPVGKYGNRNEAVSAMTRELKLAAREFDIPFLVLSQLTRGPEHEKRRPVLSDLRDSGSIEQDANTVLFIHRTEQTYGSVRECEFIVAKQRNGPIGLVGMNFMSNYARFEESIDEAQGTAA